MAWNTNKSPLEYLEQRKIYYQKRVKQYQRMSNDEKYKEKFTEDDFKNAVESAEARIEEYSIACLILAQNM